MIDLNQAIAIYCSTYPDRNVDTILDTSDEWVISGIDTQTGMEIDEPPLGINKDSGTTRIFFPPANREKLRNAKVVDRNLYTTTSNEK